MLQCDYQQLRHVIPMQNLKISTLQSKTFLAPRTGIQVSLAC